MSCALHVLLGANGDLCCLLPWFRAESGRIGRPIPVLVSKDYLPLLDGVSYVTPVEWPGAFVQLHQAIEFLKTDMPTVPVKIIQYAGSQKDIVFPSFVHEMWYNAGGIAGFKTRQLVFDRRDHEREKRLIEKVRGGSKKPIILVATHGRSSPFRDAAALMSCIRGEFGKDCKIVDLSKVKAVKPFDLIGLYSDAAALVTIDTMHAHLSLASKVPTFVLARDYPTLWHGVPYEPRFAFYCRYGQWRSRRAEFIRTMRETLADPCELSKPLAIDIHSPHGSYNPSIIEGKGGKFMTARVHPDPRGWKTRIVSGDTWPWKQITIKTPSEWSHEDMRLFNHGKKLMCSFTVTKRRGKEWFCKVGYGKLVGDKDEKGYAVINTVYPKIGKNNMLSMEKNWVFFSSGGKLHAIYKCSPHHIVYELTDRGRVVRRMSTKSPSWAHGPIRGGTQPIPFQGKLLRFFHSFEMEKLRDIREWWVESLAPYCEWKRIPFRYHMGAMIMDDKPPFRILKISSHPIMSGNEEWLMNHPRFKPNVIIPYGAIHKDGRFTVSIGVNDSWCREVTLTENQLNL